MKDKTYITCTRSEKETFLLGFRIARMFEGIVCLEGDLGSGKTIFSKGVGKGLDLDDPITSPTFVMIQEYAYAKGTFYHMDAYRIDDVSMLEDIGFYEIIHPEGITVIEWADKIKEQIPQNALWIEFEKDSDPNIRLIKISGPSDIIERMGMEEEHDIGD